MSALRLVMFSPLPPRRSGIAAYTAELLPALCAQGPVTVVNEEGLSPEVAAQLPDCGDALQVLSLAEYQVEPGLRALPHIYQIGNNADHVFAYQAFRARPGLLVQHDFNLHYLVEDATLARGDAEGYRAVLQEEYGDPGTTLAMLRRAGVFSEAQKLSLPLNRHLLRQAQGVIVHNHWIHDRLPVELREATCVVPHHHSPAVDEVSGLSQAEARQRRGLPAEPFLFLSLGFITPPKQIQATLWALGLLRQRGRQFRFVIVGERNAGFDIDAHIRRHGLEDWVTVTGYAPEADFFEYIVAADALVNLRYPTVGESSGTLARALALGLPAVVHNFGPSSEYPDDVVLKVPLELGAPAHLAATLDSLLTHAPLRDALGRRAAAYIRSHCTVQHSAEAYRAWLARFPQAGAA
ncbi:glycosyltransferase [Ideonella sp. B7]|uniref:glycosyltransferase family 4 protein n=1 Tax=Ideonella benzenivorans TaxID=2831643 RepID=UPI001CED2621|nr:glycosyltransferase [Ideonella benzenivorans]MCA6215281.1 glycosyltransferase [Ideonella benzenivorans]